MIGFLDEEQPFKTSAESSHPTCCNESRLPANQESLILLIPAFRKARTPCKCLPFLPKRRPYRSTINNSPLIEGQGGAASRAPCPFARGFASKTSPSSMFGDWLFTLIAPLRISLFAVVRRTTFGLLIISPTNRMRPRPVFHPRPNVPLFPFSKNSSRA